MSLPIRCYFFNHHHGLIFNPESVRLLREKYRIVGFFTGTLADCPRQNNELGLPLEVSLEECFLLLQRELITLIELLPPFDESLEDQKKYLSSLDDEFERQKIENGHERINEILVKRHSIVENARQSHRSDGADPFVSNLLATNNAWQNASRTLEDAEREILLSIIEQRLKQFNKDHMFVRIPLESSRQTLSLRSISLSELRSTISSAVDRLRCDVFCDLYSRGYWISDGAKFGGDYLLYLDDPSRCHSTFIVNCVLRHENEIDGEESRLPLTHLIGRCRVAVNVKKICVFASRRRGDDGSDIDYLSMNWNGF